MKILFRKQIHQFQRLIVLFKLNIKYLFEFNPCCFKFIMDLNTNYYYGASHKIMFNNTILNLSCIKTCSRIELINWTGCNILFFFTCQI